jgi:hypothetical protein
MFTTFIILVGACDDAHAMLGIKLLNLHSFVFFCKKLEKLSTEALTSTV